MKTTALIILCLCSFQSQSQKPSIFDNPKMLKMNQENWDNFFIAHRHLEPMKHIPKDIFYERNELNGCLLQFDVHKDMIIIFEPIAHYTDSCLLKTCLVKSEIELDFFRNNFPKVKIPKRILSKIK